MKKSLIYTLGLFITVIAFASCGGSGDDEARQQAIRDSLYNDSIMQAQAEQRMLDSLRQDSLEQALAASDSLLNAEKNKPRGTATKVTKPKDDKPANVTTTVVTKPVQEVTKPKTGKDAVKGGTSTTSGKGAIKGKSTKGGGKSGKDAIKGK